MSPRIKSQGVHRLSIVGGIAGAIAEKVAEFRESPYTAPTIGKPEFWVGAAFGFLLGWLCVRLVAWVVAGFLADRETKRQTGADK